MSMRSVGPEPKAARLRSYPVPMAIVLIALIAMMLSALGYPFPSYQVRSVAVGIMGAIVFFAILAGRRLPTVGLPIAFLLFPLWAFIRVLFDGGFQLEPIFRVVWFPLTFFALAFGQTSRPSIDRLVILYVPVASFFYLSTAFGQGLSGPAIINSVYYVALSLPLALSMKSAKMRIVLVSLIFVVIVVSEKRTAMVALLASLVFAAVVSVLARRRSTLGKQRSGFLAGMVILIGWAGYSYIESILDSNLLAKFRRLEEDEGSGRASIFEDVYERIGETQGAELFLGRGLDAVSEDFYGVSAHNDFLEMAYNFGLIGLAFYLLIYVALLSKLVQLVREGSEWAGPWAASIVTFTVTSFLSHLVLLPSYVGLLAIFWGLAFRLSKPVESSAGGENADSDTRELGPKLQRETTV